MASLLDGAVHAVGGIAKEGVLGSVGSIFGRGINKAFPYTYLEPTEYIQMHLKGLLDKTQFVDLMSYAGLDLQHYQPSELQFIQENKDEPWDIREGLKGQKFPLPTLWMMSQKVIPQPEEIILMLQRDWISYDLADWLLRQHGFTNVEERKLILRKVDEFPTVQDLIQFSVRHGFEPDILKTFGYAKEVPTKYLEWAKKIGLGGSSKVPIEDSTDENSQPIKPHDATWAEQHWFAHWILPSLGDAYEMLHRLYPDSDFGPSPDFKQGREFTPELLALFQRAQDIPQYWRDRLQAISFLPYSRIDVRRMYNLDVIDDKEVYHAYRAQGYNDDKSKKLLEYAKSAKADIQFKEELYPKAKELCSLYSIGILTEVEVRDFTRILHIPDVDVNDFLNNCKLVEKKTQVESIKKAMHTAYLKGKLDEGTVRDELNSLNIRPDAQDSLILQWDFEKQYQYKEENAKEAQNWYEQGIITRDELIGRLQNLLIEPGNVLIMVQQSDIKLEKSLAKEIATKIKEQNAAIAKTQKAIEKQDKEKAKEEKDRIKLLLASSTQVNLKKWWNKKLITAEEVTYRLELSNYPPADIARWLTAFA